MNNWHQLMCVDNFAPCFVFRWLGQIFVASSHPTCHAHILMEYVDNLLAILPEEVLGANALARGDRS